VSTTGMLERHEIPVQVLRRLADPALVVLALWVLTRLNGVAFGSHYQVLVILTALTTATTFSAAGAYRPWRSAPFTEQAHLTVLAWTVVAGTLLAIAYATKTSALFDRRIVLTWMVTAPAVLVVFHVSVRAALRHMRTRGRNVRTFVIVGGGDLARRLYDHIQSSPWLGMRALGYFEDGSTAQLPIPHLGTFDQLAAWTRRHNPSFAYVALPMHQEKRIREVVERLCETPVSVYLVPDIFTFQLLNARVEQIDGLPVIGLRESPFRGTDGWLKRAEDVVIAVVILTLISPLLALIAIGVKLTSPGPAIFTQRRYGLDGRPIRIYKFRTMTVCEDGDVARQAVRSDPRVTRFGAFLRHTSLDELPQFLNVLQGRMSIVGPRPHPIVLNEQYRKLIKGYMLRHKVRPGITGLAQVNGYRGETDTLEKMEKRVEYDLSYIQSWSLQLDLKIIGQTIWKGFRQPTAF
jgi:putative colanic acid biosynthesis UDP-glucose lipid carrier transferase